jgi:hypothetical protein
MSDDVSCDRKYLNTIIKILFDEDTLANSSISGRTGNNKDDFECNKLDENKIRFLKGK